MRRAQCVQAILFLAFGTLSFVAPARGGTTEVADGQPLGDAKPAAAKSESRQYNIYTFYDLIQRSEKIVLAEVGKDKDGGIVLNVKQALKSPPPDPYKLAASRLAESKADPKAPPPAPAPEVLHVQIDKMALPPEGTQAVFFFWEHGTDGVYRVAHPQCIYDAELLPQIKLGVTRPHAVADGRYLRDWDRQMAQRARQRDADRALDQLKGGEMIMGLRLLALRPQLSVRRDNSFSITAKIENAHKKDQAIYNGPAVSFGVRLRPKNGGASIVLHQSSQNAVAGVDDAVLAITDVLDFSTVPHESSFTKDLFFDAKIYPALGKLDGEYLISTVYSSAFDGAGLDVGSPVWTGTLISEDATIAFTSPSANKTDGIDPANAAVKESRK